jgi:hypothetical protein
MPSEGLDFALGAMELMVVAAMFLSVVFLLVKS